MYVKLVCDSRVTAACFVDLCAADKALCEWNVVQHLDSSKYPLWGSCYGKTDHSFVAC